jgi:hypothetical protein
MVTTITGLANRRSWPMLRSRSARGLSRAASHAPEIPHHDTLRNPNGTGPMPSCSSGVRRNMYEDGPIGAVAALQQVLAEQAGRADANAQPGGHGAVVPRRLAEPGVQCAERQEDRGSEAGGSNSGIRQTGLLSRDPASEAARCGAGFRINRNPGHTGVSAPV